MISVVDAAAVERIVETVLDALGRGDLESPPDLLLLLRRYIATGRPELSEALGSALGRVLDRCTSPDRPEAPAPEWLPVFVEAAGISEDERLPVAAASLVAGIRRSWPGRGELLPSFRAIEGCLSAAHLGNEDDVATSAIDELERLVGRSYEPGEGLAGHGVLEHAAAASTLLTAFAVAGRLPYAMLAEELIQHARRTWWNENLGGFGEQVAANCEMARVLCRMSALHSDGSYRDIAVLAPSADYAKDARRTLARVAPSSDDPCVHAALYALALDEYLKLQIAEC